VQRILILKEETPVSQPQREEVGDDPDPSQLLRFSLHFYPYSPTAAEDYERLKSEVRRYDIVNLLKEKLAKSRVHVALSKKIISAIRFIDDASKNIVVLSIIENYDVLYQIMSSALRVIADTYGEVSPDTRNRTIRELRSLIHSDSCVFRVDIHLAFAVRVISSDHSADNVTILQQIYERSNSPIVRRDIIITMANWGEWYWLSDLKNRFRQLSGAERRAIILASYRLKDEGDHWRDHIRKELNPFEIFIMKWAGEKANVQGWSIPLR
jgi:hypothetical protein